jgi:hypothetical protein
MKHIKCVNGILTVLNNLINLFMKVITLMYNVHLITTTYLYYYFFNEVIILY